jgi:hypothetical protein
VIVYQTIGEIAQAWIFALRSLRRPQVREPFFIVGGLQLILLLALGNFHSVALAGFMAPVVRALGGEAALHYPDHFWALPEIYRSATTVLGILFTYTAWGVATLRFAGEHGTWQEGFRRAPALMAVAVFATGTPWLITSLFDLIPTDITLRTTNIRLGLQGIELLMIVITKSLVAFAIPFILLLGMPFAEAVTRSAKLLRHSWLTIFAMIAIPMAILFPSTFFMFEMDMSAKGMRPEGVGLLLTANIVIRLCFDSLVVGGVTAIFIHRTGRSS